MRFRQQTGWIWKMAMRLAALLVVIFILITGCTLKDARQLPAAENGILDLTAWDWDKDGLVPLSGEWRFEWKSPPSGMQKGPATTLHVPGMWDEVRGGEDQRIPAQGYAVYQLSIRHRPGNDLMAIRIPSISTAYELFINGKPALVRGRAGTDKAGTEPYEMPATVYLADFKSPTELRLTVGNFHHRHGGIRSDLILGKADQIDKLQSRRAALEFIVFGCLMMIGLYHAGLYALRRREIANLFFSMLCVFVALRMGLIGEGFLFGWFPWLGWEEATRIEYIAFVLSGWSGMAYYHRMYPGEIRRFSIGAMGAAAALLTATAAILPTVRFTSWLIAYQAYLLTICVILIAALILSKYRNREGARLALIGAGGMVLTVINDMLFYNGWWRSVDLVPFGLLFLIIMNSFIIALRSSRTFDRAAQLSTELKQWNDRLEERITERTEELRRSYETLEEAKTGLERMELSRRQLVSNISHDLRTPITLLQGYLEALRDGVISDAAQRESTIRLMLGKVEGLNGLIHDLFELSVLEARKVDLSCVSVTLEEWRERLAEQYELDLKEKGIHFSCVLGSDRDGSAQVSIDIPRIDRVFANLIFNAVRYTPQGGMIRIVLRCLPDRKTAEITVEDSGSGIHPDDLPHIFDRFYKKDKSRHSSSGGSGLGLAISREIVELHGGSIGAYNRPEGGGAFRMLLPLS